MTLYEASLQITEEKYREMPCASFSLLQKYDREGFGTLFSDEELSTPSLSFGSAVDCMITEGEEVFNEKYYVTDIPKLPPTMHSIVSGLLGMGHSESMVLVKDEDILQVANDLEYQRNWKDATRIQKIREECSAYYNTAVSRAGKKIISKQEYSDVSRAVEALKTDRYTSHFFSGNDPFNSVERYYQLKFCVRHESIGSDIKGMLDLVCIDHANKAIHLCDLKTTKDIYSFEESFYKYRYYLQAALYTWLVRQTIKNSCPELADYTIMPYKFIVVDRNIFQPVVFEWEQTSVVTDPYGKPRKCWEELFSEVSTSLKHQTRNLPTKWYEEIQSRGMVTLKNYSHVYNKN